MSLSFFERGSRQHVVVKVPGSVFFGDVFLPDFLFFGLDFILSTSYRMVSRRHPPAKRWMT